MKFHAAILTPNGEVTAKVCRDGDSMARDGGQPQVHGRIQTSCSSEKLSDDPTEVRQISGAKFGDSCWPYQFVPEITRWKGSPIAPHPPEWQQVEPLSAMGKFYVRGELSAASFYLHGFVPELDEAVLEATEVQFDSWLGGAKKSRAVCRGLRSIKERPVLIVFPGSKKVLSPDDWRIIGNVCPCFAAVFFGRAEAAIMKIEKFWNDSGFPTSREDARRFARSARRWKREIDADIGSTVAQPPRGLRSCARPDETDGKHPPEKCGGPHAELIGCHDKQLWRDRKVYPSALISRSEDDMCPTSRRRNGFDADLWLDSLCESYPSALISGAEDAWPR